MNFSVFVVLIVSFIIQVQCSLVGIANLHTDAIFFGTLNTQSGLSTFNHTFSGLTIDNNVQFAYSDYTKLYTFIAYDVNTYLPVIVTVNAKTGSILYNSSLSNGPYPYGLQYDSSIPQLYGQLYSNNGTGSLVAIDPKTFSMKSVGFSFQQGEWWSFVASAYDESKHIYYALYVSPDSENLIAIDSFDGSVKSNVSLSVNNTVNVYGLQCDNNTNTLYVIGLNKNTSSFDLAIVNPTTGNLKFLGLFNSTIFNGDVTGMGLDKVHGVLSVVSTNGANFVLTTVDLVHSRISATIQLPQKSISWMLAYANL